MDKYATLRKLYDHFKANNDELSLEVFSFLLHYDWNYIVATSDDGNEDSSEEAMKFIEKCKSAKQVIIYGAGIGGSVFFPLMKKLDVDVIGFMDTYKTGSYIDKPIISLNDYKKLYNNALIVIAVGEKYLPEVKKYLRNNGINNFIYSSGNAYDKNSIFHTHFYAMSEYAPLDEAKRLRKLSGTPQYFSLHQLSKADIHNEIEEIFVDIGCFNGENSRDFLEWNNGKGRIIALEPDKENYKICKEFFQDIPSHTLYPYAAGDKSGVVRFNEGLTSSSHVTAEGNTEVQVVKLDEILKDIPVTFIKMDIEGYELSALKGAKETIQKYAPKLAICVYHKQSDIWEIPEFIWSIKPDYAFYLRHYEDSFCETVLYAIP